jgi:hypothetical protein
MDAARASHRPGAAVTFIDGQAEEALEALVPLAEGLHEALLHRSA